MVAPRCSSDLPVCGMVRAYVARPIPHSQLVSRHCYMTPLLFSTYTVSGQVGLINTGTRSFVVCSNRIVQQQQKLKEQESPRPLLQFQTAG